MVTWINLESRKEIKSLEDLPEDTFGFIYKITNLDTGKKYIGKKQIFSSRKIKLSKRQLEQRADKRSSKFKKVVKESDWLNYTGSNSELNEDIKNGANIKKEILKFCPTKSDLTYYETKYLFKEDVLEREDYYNKNILGKFYKKL